MNTLHKRNLINAGIAIGIVLLVAAAFGGARKRIPDSAYIQDQIHQINSKQAQIVLIGDSMLYQGIDPANFETITGRRSVRYAVSGSASAYWYLIVKNVVTVAGHKPSLIVVFFRDSFLTDPGFRVREPYRSVIDQIAMEDEELLDRLAYWPQLNFVELYLQKHVGIYQLREKVKKSVEGQVKQSAGTYFNRNANDAISRVFLDKNMVPELMTVRQLSSEEDSSLSKYDFAKQLPKSFLPCIVQMTRNQGIQLVFVRVKRRRYVAPGRQPAVVRKYIQDLQGYLSSNNVPLIDFSDDVRIRLEHFGLGDHLNLKRGRPLFTRMVAEKLAPYLPAAESEKQTVVASSAK